MLECKRIPFVPPPPKLLALMEIILHPNFIPNTFITRDIGAISKGMMNTKIHIVSSTVTYGYSLQRCYIKVQDVCKYSIYMVGLEHLGTLKKCAYFISLVYLRFVNMCQ